MTSQPLGLHDRALRLLAVRSRSRRELQRRLVSAGFDADEVEDELLRLERVGLVDDAAFATAVSEHELGTRRAGRRAVVGRLREKGVEQAVIERALEDAGGPGEEERALALAETRLPRLRTLEPEAAYRRLLGFLQRRGYGFSTAHAAASRALGQQASD
jgi:regulatory protein